MCVVAVLCFLLVQLSVVVSCCVMLCVVVWCCLLVVVVRCCLELFVVVCGDVLLVCCFGVISNCLLLFGVRRSPFVSALLSVVVCCLLMWYAIQRCSCLFRFFKGVLLFADNPCSVLFVGACCCSLLFVVVRCCLRLLAVCCYLLCVVCELLMCCRLRIVCSLFIVSCR